MVESNPWLEIDILMDQFHSMDRVESNKIQCNNPFRPNWKWNPSAQAFVLLSLDKGGGVSIAGGSNRSTMASKTIRQIVKQFDLN